ncbi:MAG: hypothetical protein JRH19_09470 [Deltaproteobacteria bacterium]|nr:hypothetical protein [Deltaproteobacteria bacterium]
MAKRMLCTDCSEVSVPDTVLEGSDLLELIGWACFVLPGLLYSVWRHLLRFKVCPHCGSGDLMREARAAARRRQPDAYPSSGRRVRSLSGDVHLPQGLHAPRTRLWRLGFGASLVVAAALTLALAMLQVLSSDPAVAISCAASLLGLSWLLVEIHRLSRVQASVGSCRAWGADGRPLRIEQI